MSQNLIEWNILWYIKIKNFVSAKFGGTVGIVHIYNDDLDWILEKSKAGPYTVVLPIDSMKKDLMLKFIARPDKIAGILIINNGTGRFVTSHLLNLLSINSVDPFVLSSQPLGRFTNICLRIAFVVFPVFFFSCPSTIEWCGATVVSFYDK